MAICVTLAGGMGNCLFQYAAGRHLALRRNTTLLLDKDTWLAHDPQGQVYGLDAFCIQVEFGKLDGRIYQEKSLRFDPAVLDLPDGVTLRGYFQCAAYFESISDLLLRELTPREALAWDVPNAVGVHFRRGVGNHDYHGIPGEEYYRAAMEYVKQRVPQAKFLAFSNEPEWVRQHYPELEVAEPVVRPAAIDLWRMSRCGHLIAANSTYSWWAGWLGPDKRGGVVVAPRQWFRDPRPDASDIVPERWTRL